MNKKQFVILLGLVVVLGLWSISSWRGEHSAWSSAGTAAGQKLLGEFDVNAVAQLNIKQGTNELVLAKKNEIWRVAQRGDYPANFAEISSLLLKLKDLKVVQTEQVGPSQLPRLELAAGGANSPTVVEFRAADGKVLDTLTLGKKHMKTGGDASPMSDMGEDQGWPDGRYVQAGQNKDGVAVISDPLNDLEPDAKRWVKKDFIKVEKPNTISVAFTAATNSWTLARETETAPWQLADVKGEEKLDTGKIAGVTSPFSSPTINDVATGLTPDQTGLKEPITIKISTFDGFDYTVMVGNKTNDNYLLKVAVTANLPKERAAVADEKPEDKEKGEKAFAEHRKQLEEKLTREAALSPWTFEVSSWTVDALLKTRAELLEEKKADAATPKESSIPILSPAEN